MVDNSYVKIYVLKHPDTEKEVYIGKTEKSLSRRLGNHIANAKGSKHNTELSNWILQLLSENKKPIISLLEECHISVWEDREKHWISQFDNLFNLTIGGKGSVGFTHLEETKNKLKIIKKGKAIHTEEFKERMSLRLKGKPLTEEHKAAIGKANKGKKASLETKLKLSESHKGITQSEETKRKRSEAIKAWWNKRRSVEDIVSSTLKYVDGCGRVINYIKAHPRCLKRDDYITPEGKFEIVLFGKQSYNESEKKVIKEFVTNFDGEYPAKSPIGLFEELNIPNDLGYVIDKVSEYYEQE